MAKRGRPTLYTPEIAEEICARLTAGEGLKNICDSEDRFPAESTVRLWVVRDESGFSAMYHEARQVQALRWADELVDISDNEDGDVARDKLRLDARKWSLARLLPRTYGDKVPTDSDGNDVPVVHFSRTQK